MGGKGPSQRCGPAKPHQKQPSMARHTRNLLQAEHALRTEVTMLLSNTKNAPTSFVSEQCLETESIVNNTTVFSTFFRESAEATGLEACRSLALR